MTQFHRCKFCGLEDYFHFEKKKTFDGRDYTFLVSDHNNAVHDCRNLLKPWQPPKTTKVYCPWCSIYYNISAVCKHLLEIGFNEESPPLHPTQWVEEKLHEIKQRDKFPNLEKKEKSMQKTLD